MSMRTSSPRNYSTRRATIPSLLFAILNISIIVFKAFTIHQYQFSAVKSHHYLKNANEIDMQKKRPLKPTTNDDNKYDDKRKCRPLRKLKDTPLVKPAVYETPGYIWLDNNCLQFQCEWRHNHTQQCDTFDATNYNGEDPPCCVHTLRDMAQAFDDVMCILGLEYFTSYGMLLGLIRSDRLIPWTSDNDYIATENTISALMNLSPKEKKVFDDHGLAFFYDGYYFRLCITPKFMKGKLAQKWTTYTWDWYPMVYPYADVFIAHEDTKSGYIIDELSCEHPNQRYHPAKRLGVYNNSFSVSVPHDSEAVLESIYGRQWRKPDSKKTPHGDTKCKGYYKKRKSKRKSSSFSLRLFTISWTDFMFLLCMLWFGLVWFRIVYCLLGVFFRTSRARRNIY